MLTVLIAMLMTLNVQADEPAGSDVVHAFWSAQEKLRDCGLPPKPQCEALPQAKPCMNLKQSCDGLVHACWPENQKSPASELEKIMLFMAGEAREQFIEKNLTSGNFPESYKNFRTVSVKTDSAETIELSVAPDYLALGSDQDYLRTPMSPVTAQKIADQWGMLLPTSKMVDAIYFAADKRIPADPLGASPEMTSTQMYINSENKIEGRTGKVEYGEFTAGEKKDVLIGPQPGKVRIYGWAGDRDRGPGRMPYIQPEGDPHGRNYADYSHGIRFISQWVQIKSKDGCEVVHLRDALTNPKYCRFLSYHCPMAASEVTADPKNESVQSKGL